MPDFDRGPVKVDLDLSSTNERLRMIEIEIYSLNEVMTEMLIILKRFLERMDTVISNQERGKE